MKRLAVEGAFRLAAADGELAVPPEGFMRTPSVCGLAGALRFAQFIIALNRCQ